MTDNPAERLRNILSPFLNLVSVITLDQVEIKAINPTLTKLIEQELKVCAENVPQVRKYLDDVEELNSKKMDFDKLSKQFDEFLASQTKEDLEKWLEFDRKRAEEYARRSST